MTATGPLLATFAFFGLLFLYGKYLQRIEREARVKKARELRIQSEHFTAAVTTWAQTRGTGLTNPNLGLGGQQGESHQGERTYNA